MTQDSKTNDIAVEMLEDFQKEYMKNGLELISKSSRFVILLAIIGVLLFMDPQNSFYSIVVYTYPFLFIFNLIIENCFNSSKFFQKYLLEILLVLVAITIIYDNMKKESYTYNEMWTPYIAY